MFSQVAESNLPKCWLRISKLQPRSIPKMPQWPAGLQHLQSPRSNIAMTSVAKAKATLQPWLYFLKSERKTYNCMNNIASSWYERSQKPFLYIVCFSMIVHVAIQSVLSEGSSFWKYWYQTRKNEANIPNKWPQAVSEHRNAGFRSATGQMCLDNEISTRTSFMKISWSNIMPPMSVIWLM